MKDGERRGVYKSNCKSNEKLLSTYPSGRPVNEARQVYSKQILTYSEQYFQGSSSECLADQHKRSLSEQSAGQKLRSTREMSE